MLIKKADDKSATLTELESLAKSAGSRKRREIEEELRTLRAGLKGEREAAYLINFEHEKSPDIAVIHDLRLDIDGRVAQIDHLLIHRSLHCFVLETKQVQSGLKITDTGEFLRWNDWNKTYDGMASPLAQNERHISVLRDAFGKLLLPERAGVPLTPVFHSYVLIPSKARIDRPANFDTRRVIKMDLLRSAIDHELKNAGASDSATDTVSLVSSGTLENLARQLVARHQPITFNYRAKFGLTGQGDNRTVFTMEPEKDGADRDSFSSRPDERPAWSAKTKRRTPIRGARLAYVGVLAVAGWAIMAIYSELFLPKLPTPPSHESPSSRQLVKVPATPAPINRPPQSRPHHPDSLTPAPSPEPLPPAVRMDERSLTVTDGQGKVIAEIQGDLPKAKQEMQQSGMGARPLRPGTAIASETTKPAAVCEPKPVMADEEIAACRANTSR